jgi:hypothetical protein
VVLSAKGVAEKRKASKNWCISSEIFSVSFKILRLLGLGKMKGGRRRCHLKRNV